MSREFRVAVVGASGAVGEAMISILEERGFPLCELVPVASARSAGEKLKFKGDELTIVDLSTFEFAGVDIALFSAGGAVSREHAPRAAAAGCVVIDNTSEFRYDDDVPLIIAEVNPHALSGYRARNIVANPNCSTMQMLVALAPLQRAVGIERINVATYQCVSGAGRRGIEELTRQTASLLNFQPFERSVFPAQIAFNAIPHIDRFLENGYTREEMKMLWETRKILEDERIGVNATAVRVPIFGGHAEAVHLETREAIHPGDVRALLANAPGVVVVDEMEDGGYPTPATHAAGRDEVFVGRIRADLSHPRGIDLWVVSDNLRKGAALNSVQIAELLVKNHL